MNIKLLDVDSVIPNLALMKLATYHKTRGDNVVLERAAIPYYPSKQTPKTINVLGFDRVYASAIFKNTYSLISYNNDCDIQAGGSGVSTTLDLPQGIGDLLPDYSIYPGNDTAYGFISRGCNRHCYFCDVPKKEGRTKQVEFDLTRIIGDFKKVKFMDNNFLQLPNHMEILKWLVDNKIRCQFNQGLDFRLINKENSELLSRLKYLGDYQFAFDDFRYRAKMVNQLKLLAWIPPWRAKFYVYCSPEMDLSESVGRIEWLKERQLLPYFMRDIACFGSEHQDFYTDLAAYCNQPSIVRSMSFKNFIVKRHTRGKINARRILRSSTLYETAKAAIPPDRKLIPIKTVS